MNKFMKEKSAGEQLAEVKADRSDSIISPSHPAFRLAERAFRRGFVHALNEIVHYAEGVPAEFRAWVKANLDVYEQWRNDFRFGEASKDSVAPPPPILPYRKEIIRETEYTQPCQDCMGYGHPVERLSGWRVLCTRCSRRTPYFKKKSQALKTWNKFTKAEATPAALDAP